MDAFQHVEDLGEVAFDVRSRGVSLDDQTGFPEQFVRALDLMIFSSRDLADLDGLFLQLSRLPQRHHRHVGGIPTDRDRD